MITSRTNPQCVIMLGAADCIQASDALKVALLEIQGAMDAASSDGNARLVDDLLRHRSVLNELLIAVERKA